MTKSGRKVVPPHNYSDAELSDDSQYASLSQMEETTDDELEMAPHLEGESSNGGRTSTCTVNNNNNYTSGKNAFATRPQRNSARSVSSTSSSLDGKQHIARMPTRRPNPEIFNRNALMARENRQKKKQHLESLEQDVDSLKKENDSLRKLLKRRSSMVYKLRDERLYLKSIIANKTSIMTLLKTIQGNQMPITSSAMSFVTEHDHQRPSSAAASPTMSSSSGYLNDELDGTVHCLTADPMMTVALTQPLSSFTDVNYESNGNHNSPTHSLSSDCSSASSTSVCTEMPLDSWESLLNDDFQSDAFLVPHLSDVDEIDEQPEHNETVHTISAAPLIDCQSNVSHEHNYSNNHIIKQTVESSSAERHSRSGKHGPAPTKRPQPMVMPTLAVDQPGICLHLSGGRVSLEFCGSCHRHSMDAWDEEL